LLLGIEKNFISELHFYFRERLRS